MLVALYLGPTDSSKLVCPESLRFPASGGSARRGHWSPQVDSCTQARRDVRCPSSAVPASFYSFPNIIPVRTMAIAPSLCSGSWQSGRTFCLALSGPGNLLPLSLSVKGGLSKLRGTSSKVQLAFPRERSPDPRPQTLGRPTRRPHTVRP